MLHPNRVQQIGLLILLAAFFVFVLWRVASFGR